MTKKEFEQGNFAGIGKMLFDTPKETPYNMPHLHYIVQKNDDGTYLATNLEFGLCALENNFETSVQALSILVLNYFITSLVTNNGFDSLIETSLSTGMEQYWAAYHCIEFISAKSKNDIGHLLIEKIRQETLEQYGIKIKEINYVRFENAA